MAASGTRRRRVYVDTSVIGGCLDEEYKEPSRTLFARFESGKDIMVLSELTALELQLAPEAVRKLPQSIPDEHKEELEFTEEAAALSALYIAAGVIGETKRIDAQHIASATVHKVDVLVSWNFRHIVNLDRIRGYNSVNLRHGHPMLEIRTPREVIEYEE